MLSKDNIKICLIIIFFIITNLIFLSFYDDVWWDSSVYIGMGKYIYSLGNAGLWEESRPLILPFILGSGWKMGFDVVVFGRLVSILFSVLTIIIVYKIGMKMFSKNIGLVTAFFTAFSYTFMFFSPNMLTEIPSTFFVLLAFYYFLDNRFFMMGLFSGIAVMTRFFQVFTLIGIYIACFFYFFRKPNFYHRLFIILAGALVFILPYAALNHYLYNDIFLPIKAQSHLTKTTGWMLYREFGYYFTGLLKENFFLLLIPALPFFFRKDYRFYALASIPIIYLIIFSIVKHKEMRFMLVILPFLYLLTAYCIGQIYYRIKNKAAAREFFFAIALIWLLIAFSAFNSAIAYKINRNDEGLLDFQKYLKDNKVNSWITNPLYALNSDDKIGGLLYFHSSDNLIKFVEKNKNNVDVVLYNSCDIPCPPQELDSLCTKSRNALNGMLSNLKKIYEKEINSCKYQIFEAT